MALPKRDNPRSTPLALPCRALLLSVLTLAMAATTGCAAGSEMGTRSSYIGTTLERIHDAAYSCAERELAMAEAHNDFARYEMSRGNFLQASHHLDTSYQNVEAARAIVDARPDCWPDFISDSDGDGILDDVDDCPLDPEDFDDFEDEDGCPDVDNDNDSYLDAEDDCPNDPEDFDLFEDEDGCPEPDNDGDGIEDFEDECPNDPEDFDGDADEDGCPEEEALLYTIVHEDRIEITEQIHFAYDSDEILSESFPILDEILTILYANPRMALRIEGHTDSDGTARYNQRLSERRAASVRQYLIEGGIRPSLLESVGYGEERPIESNDYEEGRAANRRVEFHITAR